MNRALNKVEALAKGRKVKCTVSIPNAKLANEKAKKLNGQLKKIHNS